MKAYSRKRKPKHTTKIKWKLIDYPDILGYIPCWDYSRRTIVFPYDSGTYCYGKLKLGKDWEVE